MTRTSIRVLLVGALAILATQSFAVGSWTTKAPMPTGRSNFVLAESNGILYSVGGYVGTTTALATLEAYDPATDTWTPMTSMPTARSHAGGAFVDGILYVVGGFDFSTWQPVATVEAYDPTTDTWTTKSSMLEARYSAGVAVVDGTLYAVGGTGGGSGCGTVLSTVESYDPATDTWTARAPMSAGRHDLGVGAVDGILYAVGGEGCTPGSRVATTESYDPGNDTWTTRAPMSTVRGAPGAAALNGLLYVVGGASGYPYTYLATAESYDPATDAWTSQPSMPTARHSPGVAAVDGVLYVVGGTNDATWFRTTEALVAESNDDPVADAGADQVLDATSEEGAAVSLDGTGSSDADGDAVTFQWNAPAGIVLDDPTSATPTGTFPLGVHMVTLTVFDGRGGLDTDDVVIQVEDSQPPQATCTTDLAALWPPDHDMVDVEVRIVASDLVSDPGALVLASVTVTSDEPDDAAGNGDGATTGDVDGADGYAEAVDVTSSFAFDSTTGSFVGIVSLRAERSGSGHGRSYGIVAAVEDASGNATWTSCVVVVPHSRGR